MDIQQTLLFSFLKTTRPIKQKKQLFNNVANKNEVVNILGFKSIWISL